jgi:hypothetical protein
VPRIDIDIPEHGWLPIRLELDGGTVQFEASDVDEESLPNLIRALLDLGSGSSTLLWWYLEPDLVEFRFDMRVGQVDFTITRWSGGVDCDPLPGTDRNWARWSGSRAILLAEFERALAALEPNLPPDPHWPQPFPSALLRELQLAIRSERP